MRIKGLVASVALTPIQQEATLPGGAVVMVDVPTHVVQIVTPGGTVRALSAEAPAFAEGDAVVITVAKEV